MGGIGKMRKVREWDTCVMFNKIKDCNMTGVLSGRMHCFYSFIHRVFYSTRFYSPSFPVKETWISHVFVLTGCWATGSEGHHWNIEIQEHRGPGYHPRSTQQPWLHTQRFVFNSSNENELTLIPKLWAYFPPLSPQSYRLTDRTHPRALPAWTVSPVIPAWVAWRNKMPRKRRRKAG